MAAARTERPLMSPFIAIHSRIFLISSVVVTALVAVGGAILAILKFGLRKNVQTAWLAYKGWLVMIPIIALCIILGRQTVIVGITLLAGLGFRGFALRDGIEPRSLGHGNGISSADRHRRDCLGQSLRLVSCDAGSRDQRAGDPSDRVQSVRGSAANRIARGLCVYLLVLDVLAHRFFSQWPKSIRVPHLPAAGDRAERREHFTFGRLLGRRPLRDQISPRKTWGGCLAHWPFQWRPHGPCDFCFLPFPRFNCCSSAFSSVSADNSAIW